MKDKIDWINVTDRLPPDAEEVWTYDAEEGVILATLAVMVGIMCMVTMTDLGILSYIR